MTTTNRETVRDGLAILFTSNMVGAGKPVQAVYNYSAGDFQGQSPVVLVKSAGTGREELSYDTDFYNSFYLSVEVWVLYADPASSWTEADAEDRLDLIEKSIAEVLSANYSHSSGLWDRISYDGRTQVMEAKTLAGETYLLEIIPIKAEKDDT